jgi:hypothetical protein
MRRCRVKPGLAAIAAVELKANGAVAAIGARTSSFLVTLTKTSFGT